MMIEKFLNELREEMDKAGLNDSALITAYEDTYAMYVRLGQSEFDIIRHFGEPKDIVDRYKDTGKIDLPDMDSEVTYDLPEYLTKSADTNSDQPTMANIAPTTKAGMVCNDIFFVGLGLLFALAGCIALLVVSLFMTAGSVVQMGAVWQLATKAEQIGGFALAIVAFVMSVIFYAIIVWIVKVVVRFMKRYARDHKENWAKAA